MVGDKWFITYKRIKLKLYLTPNIKINTKWDKDLNIGAKTKKVRRKDRHKL